MTKRETDISVRPMWEWQLHRDDGTVLISFAPTEQEAYDEANAAKLDHLARSPTGE